MEDLWTDAKLLRRAISKTATENPVEVLSDGQQAVEYLSGTGSFSAREPADRPVLVLLDLKLPKKDGFEVLEWIRQQDELKDVPVVILTSSNLTPDTDRAYELGAADYLVKPARPEKLDEVFRRFNVSGKA